jgi:hypothetical protein
MSDGSRNAGDVKLLPGATTAAPGGVVVRAGAAARQLADMPREELDHLADEYGLDPTAYKTRQALVSAVHERRQLIASLDRDAMLDVIRWGRRPVTAGATSEQIAQEIARIRSMKFAGLSQRGLVVLARLRGSDAGDDEPVPQLIKMLKKREGLFSRMNRRRRSMIAGVVAKMVGEEEGPTEYQYLPPPGGAASPGVAPTAPPPASLKDEIEESGLFGGLANRVKKTADSYLNQKLDEIEARIDRKLDEIDRRLAEWRDKEIANRIRILKITLWASVIVAAASLVYSYVKVYFYPSNPPGSSATRVER